MCTRKGYAASVSQLALATAALYFPLLIPHSWGKISAAQPKAICSEFPYSFLSSLPSCHPALLPQTGQGSQARVLS